MNLPIPQLIDTLPNSGVPVLLMRRTGNNTVKTSVGFRFPTGELYGWHGSRPPTHWVELPPFKPSNGRPYQWRKGTLS